MRIWFCIEYDVRYTHSLIVEMAFLTFDWSTCELLIVHRCNGGYNPAVLAGFQLPEPTRKGNVPLWSRNQGFTIILHIEFTIIFKIRRIFFKKGQENISFLDSF